MSIQTVVKQSFPLEGKDYTVGQVVTFVDDAKAAWARSRFYVSTSATEIAAAIAAGAAQFTHDVSGFTSAPTSNLVAVVRDASTGKDVLDALGVALLRDSGVVFGGKPIYLVGDSNLAVANRETDFATASIINNAFVWSAAILVPPGTVMRTYGFADERFNFTGTLEYVGGLPTLRIPTAGIENQAVPAAFGFGTTIKRAQARSAWGDRGIPFWVHGTSGRRYRWHNRARSGSDTRAMLANLDADIAGEKGICVVLGTMNDALQGFAESLTESNYRSMFTKIRAAGHRLIVGDNPTFGTGQSGYRALNQRQLRQAAMLRALAKEFGADLVPVAEMQINKSSAEATPTAAYVQADSVHLTPTFLQLLAPVLTTLLDKNGAGSVPIQLMANAFDARYDAAGSAIAGSEDNPNVARNGQMAGAASTGTAGGPDLYAFTKNVNVTLAPSKAAGALGATNKLVCTMTSTGSGQEFIWVAPTIHTDLSAGKKISLACAFETTSNVNFYLAYGALLTFTGGGTDQPLHVYTTDVAAPGNAMPTGNYGLTLLTPDFEVPLGYTLTSVRPYAQISARAVMTAQDFKFERVTPLVS